MEKEEQKTECEQKIKYFCTFYCKIINLKNKAELFCKDCDK